MRVPRSFLIRRDPVPGRGDRGSCRGSSGLPRQDPGCRVSWPRLAPRRLPAHLFPLVKGRQILVTWWPVMGAWRPPGRSEARRGRGSQGRLCGPQAGVQEDAVPQRLEAKVVASNGGHRAASPQPLEPWRSNLSVTKS